MINTASLFQFNKDLMTWNVPADLPYFEGHFPKNPVLPAIAILDLSLVIVNSLDSNLKGRFLTIKSAKFSEVIRPLDTLTIAARCDQANQSWTMEFTNQNSVTVSKLVFTVI